MLVVSGVRGVRPFFSSPCLLFSCSELRVKSRTAADQRLAGGTLPSVGLLVDVEHRFETPIAQSRLHIYLPTYLMANMLLRIRTHFFPCLGGGIYFWLAGGVGGGL